MRLPLLSGARGLAICLPLGVNAVATNVAAQTRPPNIVMRLLRSARH